VLAQARNLIFLCSHKEILKRKCSTIIFRLCFSSFILCFQTPSRQALVGLFKLLKCIHSVKPNLKVKWVSGYNHTMFKLGAKDLRKTAPTPETFKTIKRNPIYLVLDRVIDTYNIGSLFRLADAIAAEKVFICGDTEYPPSSRIHKAAVGTEEWVPWQHNSSTVKTVQQLKAKDIQIVAVEQSPKSIAYSLLPSTLKFPCAIVVGNETDGVSKEVLDLADIIVELPMFGVNKSFNVWGSCAVIAYKVLELL